MDYQRIRNLTTGRLHTNMDDIYKDIEMITGESGIMTHMLPNVMRAMEPWLKVIMNKRTGDADTDERFFDGKYDVTHTGDVPFPSMSKEEKAEFWKAYGELPSLLEGKKVISVSC
jgi:hypothetical protein